MNKTALYNAHKNLNAKIVSFADYLMPINYDNGIQFEYNAVRNNVGMFDVSHMGQIFIKGKDSLKLIEFITINNVNKLKIGDAQYSAICNNEGGIKDDVIVYRNKNDYLLIVNASNSDKIYNWIKFNNKFDCKAENRSQDYSLIAVQGPLSRKILEKLFEQKIDLKFYKHSVLKYKKNNIFISRTGYTGELGYEILTDNKIIIDLWRKLIDLKVIPCGLAVRDVLRIEMRYCLYGNEISEKITPVEANLNWILSFDKNFVGKDILLQQKKKGIKKILVGFKMSDKCIPRHGYRIFSENSEIGFVTSGTYSIGLSNGIGLGFIKSNYNEKNIYLEVRGKKLKGEIVKGPFLLGTSLHD